VSHPTTQAVGADVSICMRPIASSLALVSDAMEKPCLSRATWFPVVYASVMAPVASGPAQEATAAIAKKRKRAKNVVPKKQEVDAAGAAAAPAKKGAVAHAAPPPASGTVQGPLTTRARAFCHAAVQDTIASDQTGPAPSDGWRQCDLFVPLSDELKRLVPKLNRLVFALDVTSEDITGFLTNETMSYDQRRALNKYMALYELVLDDARSLAPESGMETRPKFDATKLLVNVEPRAQ
jgi:hypothetical protein